MATIPLLSVKGQLYAAYYYGYLTSPWVGGTDNIPAVTLAAEGSGYADVSIPAITISASCGSDYRAELSQSIPAITISADALQETLGNLVANIPAITIIATGIVGTGGSLSLSIPAITLTASAFSGFIGSLDTSIGAISLASSAHWTGSNSAMLTIPAITLEARARAVAAEIIAMVLNTKNFGLTKYTNYDYNSLCVFDGKVIGAKSDGIYELSGTDDDGTAISWKLRTPKINFGQGKLWNVWLSGKLSGDIKMIVETADGEQYEYDAEPVSEFEDGVRIKVGKGINHRDPKHRDKYITIEFQNESDEQITIDKIQGYGMK